MVCPKPESCDMPRALMSVTPNLCCEETELRRIFLPDISKKGFSAFLDTRDARIGTVK